MIDLNVGHFGPGHFGLGCFGPDVLASRFSERGNFGLIVPKHYKS